MERPLRSSRAADRLARDHRLARRTGGLKPKHGNPCIRVSELDRGASPAFEVTKDDQRKSESFVHRDHRVDAIEDLSDGNNISSPDPFDGNGAGMHCFLLRHRRESTVRLDRSIIDASYFVCRLT